MRNRDLFSNLGVRRLALILMLAIPTLMARCGHEEQPATQTAVRPASTNRTHATAATPSTTTGTASATGERLRAEHAVPVRTLPPQPRIETRASREVTYDEAEAAYSDRRYAEATDLFARYTAEKPGNPWGFYMLGLSAWKSGAFDRAVAAFDRALELDPDHVKSQINRGRVQLDAGRPEEALLSADAAVALDPGSAEGQRIRGRALQRLGRVEEAIDAYRRAIRLDPGDAWSMNNLGLVFIEAGRYDDALRPLSRAVELRDIAIFRNNLGMALENSGHYRAAAEAYREAVGLDESHGKARANLRRVEAVQEAPGIEPVDLAALARAFADEIAGWPALAARPAEAGAAGGAAVDPVDLSATEPQAQGPQEP